MRKLLLCAMAVLALVTAGCKKDKETQPQEQEEYLHYVLESTVQKLEGHDYIDGSIYSHDLDSIWYDCEIIIKDSTIAVKDKEERMLAIINSFVQKFSNGFLHGDLIFKKLNENDVVEKTETIKVTLQQNTYKYLSDLRGEDSTHFRRELIDVVERLDGIADLTDNVVIDSVNSLMDKYANWNLFGSIAVSKSNDYGKTFTEVKTWTIDAKKQYRLERREPTFVYGFNRINKAFNEATTGMAAKTFATDEEALKYAEDSIVNVYNNRCINTSCNLMVSTDGFLTSTKVGSCRVNPAPLMRGCHIKNGINYENLRSALYEKMVEIEAQRICYADDATEMVEILKAVCREYPEASGTLQILISTDAIDSEVEQEFELPIQ